MPRHTKEHRAQMEDPVSNFGGAVWPPLPLTVCVAESASFGTAVYDLCPHEPVTTVMNSVVELAGPRTISPLPRSVRS